MKNKLVKHSETPDLETKREQDMFGAVALAKVETSFDMLLGNHANTIVNLAFSNIGTDATVIGKWKTGWNLYAQRFSGNVESASSLTNIILISNGNAILIGGYGYIRKSIAEQLMTSLNSNDFNLTGAASNIYLQIASKYTPGSYEVIVLYALPELEVI